ncbi:LPS export ABC transporter periplasmic protein LptC [Poseidonibacter sp.]|uniref:LPS export ABC transporter periplasmic protein LptC n=1 Tax=Poseidonibacter sp. TaxID=2321188 RepID=UPI003C771542
MDIRFFAYILLVVSVMGYFIPVENKLNTNDSLDIPLVVFDKPLMYTLDEENVSKIIDATHAVRYKNRDEMYDATITLKNSKPEENYNFEELKAEVIIKKADDITLRKNVFYKRDDFVDLKTDELFYNTKTKIAYNSKPYEGNYYKHYIKGTNLYLDGIKDNMKSKNVHFEVEMKNKK